MSMTTELINTRNETAQISRGKQARAAWRAWLGQGNKPSSTQMAIYALLRGKSIAKTFTPITNANKLVNGQCAWQGRDSAIRKALMLNESDWMAFEAMLTGVEKTPNKYRPDHNQYVASSSPLLLEIIALAQAAMTEEAEK